MAPPKYFHSDKYILVIKKILNSSKNILIITTVFPSFEDNNHEKTSVWVTIAQPSPAFVYQRFHLDKRPADPEDIGTKQNTKTLPPPPTYMIKIAIAITFTEIQHYPQTFLGLQHTTCGLNKAIQQPSPA